MYFFIPFSVRIKDLWREIKFRSLNFFFFNLSVVNTPKVCYLPNTAFVSKYKIVTLSLLV